jgi:Tfp pilus assembly protein PilN
MKGKQKVGVLAQEIKEVFPELVSEDDNEMLAVNYQGLVPVLINALKEQDAKLNEQQSEIDRLKKQETKYMEQEQRLERLERLVSNMD